MTSIDRAFKTYVQRQFVRIDLNSGHAIASSSSPSNWDSWVDAQCIVLLGEPGSGKSTEFEHQIARSRTDGATVVITDWDEWTPTKGIQSSFTPTGSIQDELAAGNDVVWFIDALDEGRIVAKEAFEQVKEAVKKIRELKLLPRLKLRISCRSRDWRDLDSYQLVKLLQIQDNNSDSLVALQLEPLNQQGIRTLAIERLGSEALANRFLEAMEQRHTGALAGLPLLLDMMLELYAAGEASLGANRTDLYEQAVSRLSVDKNLARQGTAQTMPKDRVKYARKIAVRSVFQAMDTCYLPESDTVIPNALNVEPFTDNRVLCLETLNTGLFTRQANGGFRFRHRSFGEFLAAQELARRLGSGTPFGYVLPLFPVEEGYLPSPLRETAAWLAGMNAPFRTWLCSKDPLTAAHGDTIRYLEDERKNLLTSLAVRFEGRSWQTEFQRFGDLAAAVPEDSIRDLLRREKSPAIRSMAMKAIAAASRTELLDDLLKIALDSSDRMDTRISAVEILMRADVKKYSAAVSNLVAGTDSKDDAHEIAGIALECAYPEYLSLDVALQSLTYGQTIKPTGMYRLFWSIYFLPRTCLDEASRRSILNALDALLNCKREWDPIDCYTEVFIDVLHAEIAEGPKDIPSVGRWLQTVVDASNEMGIQPDQIGKLTTLIASDHAFKRAYLSWYFSTHVPEPKMLVTVWLPFPECFVGPTDGDLWAGLAKEFANDPARGEPLFEQLIRSAQDFPSNVLLEQIDMLASTNSVYKKVWDETKQWDLENEVIKMLRANRQKRFQRPLPRQSYKEIAAENIELFRKGEPDALMWAVQASRNDLLGDLNVSAIGNSWGNDIADAIVQGLQIYWSKFDDTSDCWPLKAQINGHLILTNMSCSLALPKLTGNVPLSAAQVDFLNWRCLYTGRYNELGKFLWEHHRDAFWSRLEPTLTIESQFPDTTISLAWEKIARIDDLPVTLIDAVTQLILRTGLPVHAKVRKLAFSIALKSQNPDLVSLLRYQVASDWVSANASESNSDIPKITTLAAFWLCDPKSAIETIRTLVFQGERRRIRAAEFCQAINEVLGRPQSILYGWPTSISFEAYAELMPLLYFEGEAPRESTAHGFLSSDDMFARSRESLIEYLSKATSADAVAWFGEWKDDPRFGALQEWMGNLYRALFQKAVDEDWRPLTTEEAEGFFSEDKFLVKNTCDLAQLISEVIEYDVGQTSRSNLSLVPLLWEGTKTSGQRKRKPEPELQAVLFNQVMIALRTRPVVGAREPEQFDAKKPDAYISAIVRDDFKVHVPIEIKWSDHGELWTAPKTQLLNKYLKDPGNTHGIYLVAWAGPNNVKAGPSRKRAPNREELGRQLQAEVDRALQGTGKTIGVHVVDASLG